MVRMIQFRVEMDYDERVGEGSSLGITGVSKTSSCRFRNRPPPATIP